MVAVVPPVDAVMSDEHANLSYAELRDAAPAWDAWLNENGVLPAECVALPLRTDARSAAVLLALLARGQSMLLWRQPLAVESGLLVSGALPRFCRAAILESERVDDAYAVTAAPNAFRVVRTATNSNTPSDSSLPYVYLPTSGSTGNPKIVAYAHQTLLANARNCVTRLQLGKADRVMIPVPLAHMYGLGAALIPSILAGGSVRLIPEANLLSYVRAEMEFEPTTAFLTPSFCHLLVKGRKQSRQYRLTILAGDAADEQTFEAYEQRHGCTINLYGSTELGVISAGSPDDTFSERRDTAGTPLPGVRLAPPDHDGAASGTVGAVYDRAFSVESMKQRAVIDRAFSSNPAESGNAGSAPFPLRFDHAYGCAGYAGDDGTPEKPSSLYRDGWYCTADLGRLDEGGRLQLSGRLDDTIKRDGFLVAFADIERALRRLDVIDGVVVVPGGITPRGRELVAVCTATPGVTADAAAVRRSALAVLPAYAVPDRFMFVDKFPLTATTKPDRMALANMVSV